MFHREILFRKLYVLSLFLLITAGCKKHAIDDLPTHFDINKMRCYFAHYPYNQDYRHHSDGKLLALAFTDSIYYYTPEGFSKDSFNLIHNDGYDYFANYRLPTENIQQILIIAHSYSDTYNSGDTINGITNIDSILTTFGTNAQEFIFIDFKEPHTVPRHLTIEYFHTNGEHFTCEIYD